MPKRGYKRVKRRTQNNSASSETSNRNKNKSLLKKNEEIIPQSIIIPRGKISKNLSKLVVDLRHIMMPHTSENLKVRKSNVLKDFVHVASSLDVTHILTVKQAGVKNSNQAYLRIARIPRGPTLTFKINAFALSNHVKAIQKNPVDFSKIFDHSPLVILNNFEKQESRHIKIMQLTFQAMFPKINVQTTKIAECKRAVLLNYDENKDEVEIRHFMITSSPAGASKPIRRLLKNKTPNLQEKNDIADIVEDYGYGTSDSEYEDESSKVLIPIEEPKKI